MFDRYRDIIASHKSAALMRNAGLSDAEVDGWLGKLYRGDVGVAAHFERPDVRVIVNLRDGTPVATLFIRPGFKLP